MNADPAPPPSSESDPDPDADPDPRSPTSHRLSVGNVSRADANASSAGFQLATAPVAARRSRVVSANPANVLARARSADAPLSESVSRRTAHPSPSARPTNAPRAGPCTGAKIGQCEGAPADANAWDTAERIAEASSTSEKRDPYEKGGSTTANGHPRPNQRCRPDVPVPGRGSSEEGARMRWVTSARLESWDEETADVASWAVGWARTLGGASGG